MSNLLKNKEDIIKWLDRNKIENYTLIENTEYGYVVDVEGYVDLSNKKLLRIEVKFNKIKGSFYCNRNQLETLEGAPLAVGGIFDCSYNKLTSLDGAPLEVGRNFFCHKNPQLGEYQNMTNFNEIKALLEKDKLSHHLIIPEIKSIINKL